MVVNVLGKRRRGQDCKTTVTVTILNSYNSGAVLLLPRGRKSWHWFALTTSKEELRDLRGDVTRPRPRADGTGRAAQGSVFGRPVLCSQPGFPCPFFLALGPSPHSLLKEPGASKAPQDCGRGNWRHCLLHLGPGEAQFFPPQHPSLVGFPLQAYVGQRIRLMEFWLPLSRRWAGGTGVAPSRTHHGQPSVSSPA